MRALILSVLILGFCGSVHAERFAHRARVAGAKTRATSTITCSKILDVKSLSNVLYKNENLHGQRGRTFLDQDHRLGGVRTLYVAGSTPTEVDGTKYKKFACFGLYPLGCDRPYGCRYYQAYCGDKLSNKAFLAAARKNGDKYALVGKGTGTCFKLDTTTSRYGSVRK